MKETNQEETGEEAMKAQYYFERQEIEQALRKAGVFPRSARELPTQGAPWPTSWGDFYHEDKHPQLVYCTLTSMVDEFPSIVSDDMETKLITLYDELPREQNTHIKQGFGSSGSSRWQVMFESRPFVVTPSPTEFGKDGIAFRSVVVIRINGSNFRSVNECYEKILRGDAKANFKGDHVPLIATPIPIHVDHE